MGPGRVIQNERLEEAVGDKSINVDKYPIGRLIDKFGLEATIRGIKYMRSLKEADESYRESADAEGYQKGVEKGFGVESESTEPNEAVSNWESSMKDGGLGLDE